MLLVLSFLSAFALRLMIFSIISPILGYCFFTALGLIFEYGNYLQTESQTRHFKEENRMAIILLRLDRVMADRKMSLGELSEDQVGVAHDTSPR